MYSMANFTQHVIWYGNQRHTAAVTSWTEYNLIHFSSWFRTSVESSRTKQSAMSSTVYSATVSVDNVRCYTTRDVSGTCPRKSSSNLIADELLRARTDTSTHLRKYTWRYGKKRSDTYERTSIARLIYSHSASSRLDYVSSTPKRWIEFERRRCRDYACRRRLVPVLFTFTWVCIFLTLTY